MEDYELINNEDCNRYEFRIGKHVPLIEYIKTANNEVYLTHTEVPVALEGQGIGSQLAAKTLADIEKQGLRVVPLCPFVAAYIRRHPEWQHMVAHW
ncbi:MAG: N-acetyltransferase [Prevotella sp.]|jgi:predicted GNAT family acetyltransferase|nr:N-acetyltransferase [Prevotella sp.]